MPASDPRAVSRWRTVAAGLVAAAVVACGCALRRTEIEVAPGVSPSPGEPWRPPAGGTAYAGPPRAPDLPPDLLEVAKTWTLPDLVDLALRTNPDTRAVWLRARAAAASLGSERGAYWPTADLTASGNRSQGSAAAGRINYIGTTYGPSLALTYLLFDLGSRKASVEAAREALVAANWTHDAAIQDVVLAVEQGYHRYVEAKALRDAEGAAVREATVNLEAAEGRHAAGVATIADVLQARTALSQARLLLETAEGRVRTTRGALATVLGIPPTAEFEVGDLREAPDLEGVTATVERLIDEAGRRRPDVAAARALVLQKEALARRTEADGRPTLNATGSIGRAYYEPSGARQDVWALGLVLRIPVFSGFSRTYDALRAKAESEQARAELESLERRAANEVWASYQDLRTAKEMVKVSADLLESATQSAEVAQGRYRAGVGTILDLLSAQRALEGARAEGIAARTKWFLSLSQLARDTGTLWPSAPEGRPEARSGGKENEP